jgi:ketosteroid isomerase-like protein
MRILRHFTMAATLILTKLIGGDADAQPGDATTERNRQFIAQAFEQWAAGGATFFQDVLAPDVTWTIKGTSPAAGTYRGRDAFMTQAVAPFAARLATPLRPTVRNIWADGDDVIVHWDGTATAADGVPYNNSYVWIFRMANLRAVEVIAFLDLVAYDEVIRRIPLDSVSADRQGTPQ